MHQKKSAKIDSKLVRAYDNDVKQIQQMQEDIIVLKRHCTTLNSSLCEEASRNSECHSHIKELRELLASCNNLDAKSHKDEQREANEAAARIGNEETVENHPVADRDTSGMEEIN